MGFLWLLLVATHDLILFVRQEWSDFLIVWINIAEKSSAKSYLFFIYQRTKSFPFSSKEKRNLDIAFSLSVFWYVVGVTVIAALFFTTWIGRKGYLSLLVWVNIVPVMATELIAISSLKKVVSNFNSVMPSKMRSSDPAYIVLKYCQKVWYVFLFLIVFTPVARNITIREYDAVLSFIVYMPARYAPILMSWYLLEMKMELHQADAAKRTKPASNVLESRVVADDFVKKSGTNYSTESNPITNASERHELVPRETQSTFSSGV